MALEDDDNTIEYRHTQSYHIFDNKGNKYTKNMHEWVHTDTVTHTYILTDSHTHVCSRCTNVFCACQFLYLLIVPRINIQLLFFLINLQCLRFKYIHRNI